MCSPLTPERAGKRGGGGLHPRLLPLLLPVLLYELHELCINLLFCSVTLCKILYSVCCMCTFILPGRARKNEAMRGGPPASLRRWSSRWR